MMPIICLVSDFGLDDTWVGVCHAVIARACPEGRVIDLAHHIPPYDVRTGSFVAASGVYQLPEAIHVVVVDPGVGGERRCVCIVTVEGTTLIGPDNGVLIPAASMVGGVDRAFELPVDAAVSPTFHGRDVFAPSAAKVACGAAPADLWNEVDVATLAVAPFPECDKEGDYIRGEVLGMDRFGSVRLNIPAPRASELGLEGEMLEVGIGHNALAVPFRNTFSEVDAGDPLVMFDSSGWLTLSVNQGSAGDRYGVIPGSRVRVRAL